MFCFLLGLHELSLYLTYVHNISDCTYGYACMPFVCLYTYLYTCTKNFDMEDQSNVYNLHTTDLSSSFTSYMSLLTAIPGHRSRSKP